jgi:Tfp pilus assembly protein PilO
MKLLGRHDTLIAIIGTGILTAGYYWGVIVPGHSVKHAIEADIVRAQSQVGEVPLMLAEQGQLHSQLDRQKLQLEQMERTLPTDSHVSDVLRDVAGLARKSGLTINRLEPLPSSDFASYSAHPFHLSCQGSFQDIATFLKGLESQPRLVTFGSVSVTRGPEGQARDAARRPIQANINFNVYSRHAKSTKLAGNTISQSSPSSDN